MLLLAVLILLTAWPGVAQAGEWARPVPGGVLEPFTYDRGAPFARGAHRGADLVARPGESVRAPCAGVVTFAGRVPARGAGVTIRCGALVATLVDLGAARVDRGRRVGRGAPVGVAGGPVHLGARRVGEAFAYRDPLSLIARRRPPSLGPLPSAAPRRPRPAPRPVTPRPVARDVAPRGMPVAAWGGLTLVVAGLPVGAVVRRRRGVRDVAGPVAVPR